MCPGGVSGGGGASGGGARPGGVGAGGGEGAGAGSPGGIVAGGGDAGGAAAGGGGAAGAGVAVPAAPGTIPGAVGAAPPGAVGAAPVAPAGGAVMGRPAQTAQRQRPRTEAASTAGFIRMTSLLCSQARRVATLSRSLVRPDRLSDGAHKASSPGHDVGVTHLSASVRARQPSPVLARGSTAGGRIPPRRFACLRTPCHRQWSA